MRLSLGLVAAVLAASCTPPPPSPGPSPAPPPVPSGPTLPATPPSAEAPEVACGGLGCRLFDSPAAALDAVLASAPRVLAVGEAHAQKGSEGVDSTVKRFTRDVLPSLRGRASAMVIELMLPPSGCAAPEREVRREQQAVTEQQAPTAQNEYVALAEDAKKLGITPYPLRPSCDDLKAIAGAGDDAPLAMLATVTRLLRAKVEALLGAPAAEGGGLVVTYGGAMHNDVAPRDEWRSFTFAPALAAASSGRYVELDVFVPELIQDNATWRKFEWYDHYDRARLGAKAALFHPRPETYVLVLPAAR
jgi:hypothetical protein